MNTTVLAKALSSESRLLLTAFLMAAVIFSLPFGFLVYGDTSPETLTVTVQEAMTFTTDVTAFGNLTPGVAAYATTTTQVTTNSNTGYNLALHGDDQGPANTVMDHTSDASIGITDQTEWIAGAGTTTPGNAVAVGALDNSGDVLAFRMMTASGSVDVISTDWWGEDDSAGAAEWAGIASSTNTTQIGNTSEYAATRRDNSVVYYLDVPASQQTGSYDGVVTYTAVANP